MNILYSINGNLPNMMYGGGAKIVGLLLDQLKNLNDPEINPYLLAHHGIISGENLFKIHHIDKRFEKTKLTLNRIWGNIDQPFSFFSYLLKNKFFGKHFKDPGRLDTILGYCKKRTEKQWNVWLSQEKKCVVHNIVNTGAFPILANRDSKRHKVISTYQSKGSLVSDYASDWNIKDTPVAENINNQEVFEILNSDIVTFPSKGAFEIMRTEHPAALANKDVEIIYNGVDLNRIEHFLSAPFENFKNDSNEFILINVAAHVWQKRINLLLEALSAVKDEINFRLINIGEGPHLEENKNLALKLGISDRVEFVGRKSNEQVIQLMSQSNVFIMPSENVIFDIITLEAMAVGLPIIVSGDGGNFECIRNGVDGILTKVGDVQSIAEAIKFVYKNPEKAKEMGESAKSRTIKEFSNKKMLENYIKLYKAIYPN